MKPGDTISSGTDAPLKPGNTLRLRNIPTGMKIHNVELVPGKGGQMCRSAGCSSTLVQKGDDNYAVLRLPSGNASSHRSMLWVMLTGGGCLGEQRKVSLHCRATIGVMSNPQNKNRVIGKAGYKRLMGFRPTVRGVAMNPVDHPHGGGEGKKSGGRRSSVSPWGIPCKGHRTRKRGKRTDKYIVVSRHQAKRRKGRR